MEPETEVFGTRFEIKVVYYSRQIIIQEKFIFYFLTEGTKTLT